MSDTLIKSQPVKHTETSVLQLLRKRHAPKQPGMEEWAYLEQVRREASTHITRTADAMALGLWRSRGHELHGFEVKVARSDWLKELSQPEKAEVWTDIVDRWWIVAPKGIVKKDELPATWGLLEVNPAGTKLIQAVAAPLLTKQRTPINRSFLIPMLKAAGAGLKCTPEKAALDAAFEEGRQKGKEQAVVSAGNWEHYYNEQKQRADGASAAVREIEQALGQSFSSWRLAAGDKRVAEVAEALRVVLGAEKAVEHAESQLTAAAERLEQAATYVRKHVGKVV